ncbi:MAG: hypothetical protein GX760_06115 [Erysipelothrix sp.]|nr:hypothetical protein [Erysipelothrix sp.]
MNILNLINQYIGIVYINVIIGLLLIIIHLVIALKTTLKQFESTTKKLNQLQKTKDRIFQDYRLTEQSIEKEVNVFELYKQVKSSQTLFKAGKNIYKYFK